MGWARGADWSETVFWMPVWRVSCDDMKERAHESWGLRTFVCLREQETRPPQCEESCIRFNHSYKVNTQCGFEVHPRTSPAESLPHVPAPHCRVVPQIFLNLPDEGLLSRSNFSVSSTLVLVIIRSLKATFPYYIWFIRKNKWNKKKQDLLWKTNQQDPCLPPVFLQAGPRGWESPSGWRWRPWGVAQPSSHSYSTICAGKNHTSPHWFMFNLN